MLAEKTQSIGLENVREALESLSMDRNPVRKDEPDYDKLTFGL